MRIIISGGSGLIGRAVSTNLLADGHEVEIISRTPKKHNTENSKVKAIGWDSSTLTKHFERADVVINLVGASIGGDSPLNIRWTDKRKKQILDSRIKSGNMIARAIQKTSIKPKLLIQQSAVGYYGVSGEAIIDESFPNGNDFLAEVSKKWENSTSSVDAMGVRRVVTRTGVVFSPAGGIFSMLKLPFSLFVGGRLGSGDQYLPWIHIDDLVAIYRFLMDDLNAQGIFNLTAPHPVTNASFTQSMGEIMRRPTFVAAPALPIKLALGEASTLILDGQRVVPQRLLEAGYKFKFASLDDALPTLI